MTEFILFCSRFALSLPQIGCDAMKKGTKNIAFYLLMILIFGILMYLITKQGEYKEIDIAVKTVKNAPADFREGFSIFISSVYEHIRSSIGILLLQIITILLICRAFGWIFKKFGQPTVVGEIMAGIVLGPSVLGHVLPDVSAFLFPPESLGNISILSEFGLILFMFAIGMELDINEIRKKFNETIIISHTSTIVSFLCGMLTAYYVYDTYAYKGTPFLSFALFIGIAMSITAFPVLARIIQEKGLTKKHLGFVALSSAANDNITAWFLLAIVISITQAGNMIGAIYNILFSLLYMAIMAFAVRPFLEMIGNLYHNKEVVDKTMVAFMFLILIISAYITDVLGLHVLFGAFIAGVVMPANIKFRKIMTEKVEDVSLALFLPLFFVSTGLRTEIGLLNTPESWIICGIFTLVAIFGKFGGALLAARFNGENWHDSLCIGALLNTRGLMELVILTIGYEMHILPPTIFAMLVLMTLVTTFMTTPLVSFIGYCYHTHNQRLRNMAQSLPNAETFKVLLSFGRAGNGQIMLDVAHQMFARRKDKLDLTALHLTVGSDVNPLRTDKFEEVSFGPILYGAKKLGLLIHTRYEISNNAGQDICSIVNNEGFNFLLVGAGISMSDSPNDVAVKQYFRRFKSHDAWFSPNSLLKDKTKTFITNSHCDVGIFINRNFIRATEVIVIISSVKDLFLFEYANTLIKTTNGTMRILLLSSISEEEYSQITHVISSLNISNSDTVLLEEKTLTAELLSMFNFMLVSYDTWNNISEAYKEALQKMPSTIILNKNQYKKS